MNLKINGKFKIQVKMIQGSIFTFNDVDGYEIEPGDFISFKDTKTKETKKFHTSHCEIQALGDSK
jgi:hypothetical protein